MLCNPFHPDTTTHTHSPTTTTSRTATHFSLSYPKQCVYDSTIKVHLLSAFPPQSLNTVPKHRPGHRERPAFIASFVVLPPPTLRALLRSPHPRKVGLESLSFPWTWNTVRSPTSRASFVCRCERANDGCRRSVRRMRMSGTRRTRSGKSDEERKDPYHTQLSA